MPKPHSIFRSLLLRAFVFAGLIVLFLMHTASVHAQNTPRTVIARTRPTYPALAIRMHISGSVIVTANIKPDGTVANARATSGHALLQGPAEQAVRQWRFSPSNSPSDTIVEVRFVPDAHS